MKLASPGVKEALASRTRSASAAGRFQAFDPFPYHVDIGLHTPEGIAARNRERERLEALLRSATQRRGQRVFGFSFEAPHDAGLVAGGSSQILIDWDVARFCGEVEHCIIDRCFHDRKAGQSMSDEFGVVRPSDGHRGFRVGDVMSGGGAAFPITYRPAAAFETRHRVTASGHRFAQPPGSKTRDRQTVGSSRLRRG
jgi:hypothetical protein